ncbi:MAG: hypothetical protein ABH840_03000 [Nanoarchaeota archaeon]
MLEIPLYLNHGNRCGQSAMKSVLKVLKPEKHFSWEELDCLTDYNDFKFTYPCQIANAFQRLNIPFKYFIKPGSAEIILSGSLPQRIRDVCGQHAEEVKKRTNFKALERSMRALLKGERLIELQTHPPTQEMREFITESKIPICLIDYDVSIGKTSEFRGHFILLTSIGDESIEYHNNGPKNPGVKQKMSLEKFLESWNLPSFDHNLIVAG